MKKLLYLVLCLIMAAGIETAAFGAEEITIYVNGSVVQSELKPVIIDGNTLIPLRPVAEAMGCTVTWVAEEKGIKIESENISVRMVLNYGVIYTTKGTATTAQDLTVQPQLINGSTYIPMRPMVEALGGDVSWNGETKTINITYDNSSAESNYTSDLGAGRLFYLSSEDKAYSYEGDMSSGKANGSGVMTWENGDVYEGEFKDGYRNGTGTYTWANGTIYEGEYVNGKMNGKGKLTWTNGDVYVGEFKNGEIDGTGTYTWADGTVYVGECSNKGMNGYGKTNWTDGRTYNGNYKDGLKSGYGKYTYADGSVYEGEWLNDKYNGQGTMTYADGTVLEGIWENGEFIG